MESHSGKEEFRVWNLLMEHEGSLCSTSNTFFRRNILFKSCIPCHGGGLKECIHTCGLQINRFLRNIVCTILIRYNLKSWSTAPFTDFFYFVYLKWVYVMSTLKNKVMFQWISNMSLLEPSWVVSNNQIGIDVDDGYEMACSPKLLAICFPGIPIITKSKWKVTDFIILRNHVR